MLPLVEPFPYFHKENIVLLSLLEGENQTSVAIKRLKKALSIVADPRILRFKTEFNIDSQSVDSIFDEIQLHLRDFDRCFLSHSTKPRCRAIACESALSHSFNESNLSSFDSFCIERLLVVDLGSKSSSSSSSFCCESTVISFTVPTEI